MHLGVARILSPAHGTSPGSVEKTHHICQLLTAAQCCRPEPAIDLQYTSDTEYSDDDGSDEEEEDDISVCSGSTISAGGQSCTASDLMGSGFDEAYCDGMLACQRSACCMSLPQATIPKAIVTFLCLPLLSDTSTPNTCSSTAFP